MRKCETCKGTGECDFEAMNFDRSTYVMRYICPICHGRGELSSARVHKLGLRPMKRCGVVRNEQQGWIIEKYVDNEWIYVTCCHPSDAQSIVDKINKGEY